MALDEAGARPARSDQACPQQALAQIWTALGGRPGAECAVALPDDDAGLPSTLALGATAQASIASAALASAELWRLKTGRSQRITVSARHAGLEFRSERLFTLDGEPAGNFRDPLAGVYRSADGGWVRPHLTLRHHRDGLLALVGLGPETAARAELQRAIGEWSALDLEDAAAREGLPLAAYRRFEAWDRHPQAAATATLPLVRIERIGDAPPESPANYGQPGDRPLTGLRALDLTRIIAGPVCGRALAAHGAEVLAVASPRLPSVRQLAIDTGRGKRSCHLDLKRDADHVQFEQLIAGADVLLQGYRPGALAGLGFGPEHACAIRPGLVYASLSAYGGVGPWGNRRGYDSLVQTANGINASEADAFRQDEPRETPVQALDHASGYLLAAGIMTALLRRATEGGSWHVQVCLARTGQWIRELGVDPGDLSRSKPLAPPPPELMETGPSGYGVMTALRHSAQMSETPPRWERPSAPLGTDAPVWL